MAVVGATDSGQCGGLEASTGAGKGGELLRNLSLGTGVPPNGLWVLPRRFKKCRTAMFRCMLETYPS